MAQHSKSGKQKVAHATGQTKRGRLRRGQNGKRGTGRKQTAAIGLSGARRSSARTPKRTRRVKRRTR